MEKYVHLENVGMAFESKKGVLSPSKKSTSPCAKANLCP